MTINNNYICWPELKVSYLFIHQMTSNNPNYILLFPPKLTTCENGNPVHVEPTMYFQSWENKCLRLIFSKMPNVHNLCLA